MKRVKFSAGSCSSPSHEHVWVERTPAFLLKRFNFILNTQHLVGIEVINVKCLATGDYGYYVHVLFFPLHLFSLLLVEVGGSNMHNGVMLYILYLCSHALLTVFTESVCLLVWEIYTPSFIHTHAHAHTHTHTMVM